MHETKTRAHSASLHYLLLAAELLTLMLVTCLEGVPVTLTAPAPGVVAQGTQEYGFPAQHHRHPLQHMGG